MNRKISEILFAASGLVVLVAGVGIPYLSSAKWPPAWLGTLLALIGIALIIFSRHDSLLLKIGEYELKWSRTKLPTVQELIQSFSKEEIALLTVLGSERNAKSQRYTSTWARTADMRTATVRIMLNKFAGHGLVLKNEGAQGPIWWISELGKKFLPLLKN